MSDWTSGSAGKPRALYTYDAHRGALVLECLTAFAFFMALLAPRGMLMWLSLWVIAALGQRLIYGDFQGAKNEAFRFFSPGAKRVSLVLGALVGWACLSAMWSPVPAITIDKSLQVAGLVFVLGVGAILVSSMDRIARWHAARGAIHGFLVGALYLAVEHTTGGLIKRTIINGTDLMDAGQSFNVVRDGVVVSINTIFLNRHTNAFVVLSPVIVLAASIWLGVGARWTRFALLFSLSVLALSFVSNSEASKVAVIAGLIAFGLAVFAPTLTLWLFRIGWTTLALLMPLIVMVLPRAETLPEEVPFSARQRVMIWQTTAARVPDSPIFGHGASATRYLDGELPKPAPLDDPGLGRHAHNGFLQIWLELGLVGAVITALFGLLLAQGLAGLQARLRTLAIVAVTAITVLFSTSVGVWQLWMLSTYGVAALAFVMWARDVERST
ncbi:MAG: O-antigen ligase family protein [Pseudomonadota bacterium]